jgi:hypothetical protein
MKQVGLWALPDGMGGLPQLWWAEPSLTPHLPAGLSAASTSAPEQASLDGVRRPLTQFATLSRSFRYDRERQVV